MAMAKVADNRTPRAKIDTFFIRVSPLFLVVSSLSYSSGLRVASLVFQDALVKIFVHWNNFRGAELARCARPRCLSHLLAAAGVGENFERPCRHRLNVAGGHEVTLNAIGENFR